MERDFTELFYLVDNFVKNLDNNVLGIANYKSKPGVVNYLNTSEISTILIGFYQSSFDYFKQLLQRGDFGRTYQRF